MDKEPAPKLTVKKRVMEADGLYEVEYEEKSRKKIADDPAVYQIIHNNLEAALNAAPADQVNLATETVIAALKTAGKLV